jgi:hypothetical protein
MKIAKIGVCRKALTWFRHPVIMNFALHPRREEW